MRLSLFESVARNEPRADADVDLLAAFDDARSLSLIALRVELMQAQQGVRVADRGWFDQACRCHPHGM